MRTTSYMLLAFGILTVAPILTLAQNRYIGVMFGANMATLSFDNNPSGVTNSERTGILAGLRVDRVLSGTWSISTEALYSQGGANQTVNGSGKISGVWVQQTGTSTLTLDFLDLNVLLKASFGSGTIRPYLLAGPSLSSYLAGTEEDHYTFSDAGASLRLDTTQPIPASNVNWDFSVVIGAGLSFILPARQMLFVQGEYALGISDLLEDYGSEVKSRDILLSAGILFPIF